MSIRIVRLGSGVKTQVPSVLSGLTVAENLWLAARRALGREGVEAAVDAVVSELELGAIARRQVSELAHGQRREVLRQRLAQLGADAVEPRMDRLDLDIQLLGDLLPRQPPAMEEIQDLPVGVGELAQRRAQEVAHLLPDQHRAAVGFGGGFTCGLSEESRRVVGVCAESRDLEPFVFQVVEQELFAHGSRAGGRKEAEREE